MREGVATVIALLVTMLIPIAPILGFTYLTVVAMNFNKLLGGVLLALDLLTVVLSAVYAYALSEDVFKAVKRRLAGRCKP